MSDNQGYSLEELLEKGFITQEQYNKMKTGIPSEININVKREKDDSEKLERASLEFEKQKKAIIDAVSEQLGSDYGEELSEKINSPESLESAKTLIEGLVEKAEDEEEEQRKRRSGIPSGVATREPDLSYRGETLPNTQAWFDRACELAESKDLKKKAQGLRMLDKFWKNISKNPHLRSKTYKDIMMKSTSYLCSCGHVITEGSQGFAERICPKCGAKLETR